MEEEKDYSDPQIEDILLTEGNNVCNDCQRLNPKWCSINNGIFLCKFCARRHKKYQATISFIKSLEVDPFTKGEIALLRYGGNSRFNRLMTEYGIPLKKENNDYKYHTELAKYYRQVLSQETREGSSLIPRPDKRTAIQTIDEYNMLNSCHKNEDDEIKIDDDDIKIENKTLILNNPFENVNNNFSTINNPIVTEEPKKIDIELNQRNNINENKKKQGDDLDSFVDSIGNLFTRVGNNISNKMKEIGLDETLAATGTQAKKLFQNSKEYISDKSQEIAESDIFKSFQINAEAGFTKLFDKTAEFIEKSNMEGPKQNQYNNPNQNVYMSSQSQSYNNGVNNQPSSNYSNIK